MTARRLLVVTDEMEVGGSQRQIGYLLGGLDRTRWQPELLYFRNDSRLLLDLLALGIPVHHLPKRGRFDPAFVQRYVGLLRHGRYDLVHAFSLTAEFWTAIARRLMRAPPPLVSSVRNVHLNQSSLFWLRKRFALGRSAAVISNSAAGAEVAAARTGLPLRRFDIVPNGIAPTPPLAAAERASIRRELGLPTGRTFGLFVGRMAQQKNIACLVRALASMRPEQRPWFALAGIGPLLDENRRLCEAAGLQHDMRFLGERSDAVMLMKSADFLVLPSFHEGMSNVLMEAMSAGCPVLASAVGGNAELVENGSNGLLFPSDDADALAGLLQRVAVDPQLRSRLAANAVARIDNRYSVVELVAATTAVYERCLPAGSRQAVADNGAMAPAAAAGNDG